MPSWRFEIYLGRQNISSYLRSGLRPPAGPEIQISQHLEAVASAHFEIVADIRNLAICPFGALLERLDCQHDPVGAMRQGMGNQEWIATDLDLPLNFHPAAIRASAALDTPNGAA